jgi:hypothetical protein
MSGGGYSLYRTFDNNHFLGAAVLSWTISLSLVVLSFVLAETHMREKAGLLDTVGRLANVEMK